MIRIYIILKYWIKIGFLYENQQNRIYLIYIRFIDMKRIFNLYSNNVEIIKDITIIISIKYRQFYLNHDNYWAI